MKQSETPRWRVKDEYGEDLIGYWKRQPIGGNVYAATEIIEQLEYENNELRAKLEAAERDSLARNKIDPVTRLHNLCDAIAEQRHESPYTADQIDLLDAENKELREKLKAAEAAAAKAREDFKVANNAATEWRSQTVALHPFKVQYEKIVEQVRAMDLQAEKLTRQEGDEDVIIGYKFNTGCWHRILGLIAGFGRSDG